MAVATRERIHLRGLHELVGRDYERRADGSLMPIPIPPRSKPMPVKRPAVEIDLALPPWFEEHRAEAAEIFRTRKDLQKTAAGRATLAEFLERHSSRRAELLERFAATSEPGERRYINSSPNCSNLQNLRAIIVQWLRDTADPACNALAAELDREATEREDNRDGLISSIGLGAPDGLRRKLLAKHWAYAAALRRVAVSACSNLAMTYTTDQSLAQGLKAVRAEIEAEAEEIFRQKIWDSLREQLPFNYLPQITYQQYKAGETPCAELLKEFERIINQNYSGKPKRPKRYSVDGPVPYEDGEIE